MTKPLVAQVQDGIAATATRAAAVRQAARDIADQIVAERQAEQAPPAPTPEDVQHG